MQSIQPIIDLPNATALDFGPMSSWQDYLLKAAPGLEIPGKVFGGEAAHTGGAEFSLQVFAPGEGSPFLHSHREHEELYFFLAGSGEYQIDGTVFPIREGSVVRVAPAGVRAVRNTGSTPLVMLCIQYRASAPESVRGISDGHIVQQPLTWPAP